MQHNHRSNASPFGGDDLVAFENGKAVEHWEII
jgi:hypothetical protein